MGQLDIGKQAINSIQPGLFWRLSRGGGGGLLPAPLQILAMDCAIAAKICLKVECDVNYKSEDCIVRFILYYYLLFYMN